MLTFALSLSDPMICIFALTSNRNNRDNANVDSGIKYIDNSLKTFFNGKDWEIVQHDHSV